ncbi:probable proline--tRNA ligase, mitochondrial isoform X1 [Amphibalanus amphitrite]|uniref:probable proline--tRNA ligase, mitochondrial isoform X1 n=2 Tax=Amphibalanus amphitrite TaxID=1232801 RepID=UPI001C90B2F1|nr:probable proline--tRNA ligase, mitochondrial isoform X1 [Amphibalanus amphitrite]
MYFVTHRAIHRRLPTPFVVAKRELHEHVFCQRMSRFFQPIHAAKQPSVKDGDGVSKGFELLSTAGYIRQSSGGVFHILPLCQRVLDKLTRVVRQQMASVDACQLTLPTLVRDTLWKQTGRMDKMGGELMTVEDRAGHGFVLSPTHEEAVTALVGSVSPISGRQLPLRLYQITAKFRDEMRPRFGLLRCKEFLMKDLYTFDSSEAAAMDTYRAVGRAYSGLFKRLGVPVVRVRGDSGVMGGGVSHEYHVLAPVGEDRLLVRPDCRQDECPAAVNLEVVRPERETAPGEAGMDTCQACGHPLQERTGIEVGHTFVLGQLYSETLGAFTVTDSDGRVPLHMGCYGIGLTRLLAAVVESRAQPGQPISWPAALAPFTLCVITPKAGSREEAARTWALQMLSQLSQLPELRDDLLWDDRDHLTIGQRVRESRRSGHRAVLVFGRAAAEGGSGPGRPRAELITADGSQLLTESELPDRLAQLCREQ